MPSPRRTVCVLLAAGRITPAEAKRLLAVWAADRDQVLVLAAACFLALIGGLSGIDPAAHAPHLAAHLGSLLRHALLLIHPMPGGLS